MQNASQPPAATAHTNGKFHIFVQVAMLLAVITGIEIILVYVPIPKWLLVGTLIGLSAVKFGFVIFAFMHLRWDKLFCTLLFMIGLTLAGFILWALLQLFGADSSRPIESAAVSDTLASRQIVNV